MTPDSGGEACFLETTYPIILSAFVTLPDFSVLTVLNPNSYDVFCLLILRAYKGMYSRSWFLSFLTPLLDKE